MPYIFLSFFLANNAAFKLAIQNCVYAGINLNINTLLCMACFSCFVLLKSWNRPCDCETRTPILCPVDVVCKSLFTNHRSESSFLNQSVLVSRAL